MIYTYECKHCGEMEIEHSIKDEALLRCPECKSKAFKRLISGGSTFTLSGPGWARDGYAMPKDTKYGRNG